MGKLGFVRGFKSKGGLRIRVRADPRKKKLVATLNYEIGRTNQAAGLRDEKGLQILTLPSETDGSYGRHEGFKSNFLSFDGGRVFVESRK